MISFVVPKDESRGDVLVIHNTDEDIYDDRAELTVTVENAPNPA
jgi:hypothetical protein